MKFVTALILAGVTVFAAAPSFAQVRKDDPDSWGQARSYRWNDVRSGFAYDPEAPTTGWLDSNQLPAITVTVSPGQNVGGITYKSGGRLGSPDLTWYYPFFSDGAYPSSSANDSNYYGANGYSFGSVQSSPTIAGVMSGSDKILTAMFGSTSTVDRQNRNPYTTNKDGEYVVDGVYQRDEDPYYRLDTEVTGAVYALEAFAGPTETFSYTTVSRSYQPLWWYGVRNIPYYLPGDVSPAGEDYLNGPTLEQHRLMINASDTMIRAWDWDPNSAITVTGTDKKEKDDERTARKIMAAMYLAPKQEFTEVTDPPSDAMTAGAGPVEPNRYDVPERVHDRLHNLSIKGLNFGLINGFLNSNKSTNQPLNNHWRENRGMGGIKSTGTFIQLPSEITYKSRFYKLDDDPKTVRKDPEKLSEEEKKTDQLYIVGSDDGYIYALDANPDNARKVGSDTDTKLQTFLGRVVWTFRAAVKVPVYTEKSGSSLKPIRAYSYAPGESYVEPMSDSDGYMRVDDEGKPTKDGLGTLVAPTAGVISYAIQSSPVGARLLNGRFVVFVGSGIGRMYCLDAATGEEIWEFKTTPLGQNLFQMGGKLISVDGILGAAITTTPSIGYFPTAASQKNPVASPRLALFFGADDGKVYCVDAADGSPLRESATLPGWDIADKVTGGIVSDGTRYRIDHYGFCTYPFEDKDGKDLADTRVDGKYGRRIAVTAYQKPVTASVVLRASDARTSLTDDYIDAEIDRAFIAAPTNQADASVGSEPAFSGGAIYSVNPINGKVVWTFDRWLDPRRDNTNFDTDAKTDGMRRPAAFYVTPAYAPNLKIYNDKDQAERTDQAVLFAVDANGMMYAIDTLSDTTKSEDRMHWRVPFTLGDGTNTASGVYSSPVISSPTKPPADTGFADPLAMDGRSYVYIGTGEGVVALEIAAARDTQVKTDKNADLVPPQVGGSQSWAYLMGVQTAVTSADGEVTTNTSARPSRTVPVIYAGNLFAGSENGLFYCFGNQDDLIGSGWKFNNGSGSGRGPWRGARFRRPLPPGLRPAGDAGVAGGAGDYQVDVFAAGFDYSWTTVAAFSSLNPNSAQPMSQRAEFQTSQGAILEWGDPVGAIAWGPEFDAVATETDPKKRGRLNFTLSGPGITVQTGAYIEADSVSRQIFYLNPFGETVPQSIVYPRSPNAMAGVPTPNPFRNSQLSPGWRGVPYSVAGRFQPPDIEYTDDAEPGVIKYRRQASVSPKNQGQAAKFHLGNPLDVRAYFTGGSVEQLVLGSKLGPAPDPEIDRNGNARVPIVASVIGDHGTNSLIQRPDSGIGGVTDGVLIVDRSNLTKLRALVTNPLEKQDVVLRVKVQPSRLRWVGGPAACYKPLFHIPGLSNTWPSMYPPQPYLGAWGQQVTGTYNATSIFGAEAPPFSLGEVNQSQDYPDIQTSAQSWIQVTSDVGAVLDANAARNDAMVGSSGSRFVLQVAAPRYQPANYSPPNVNPANNPGRGPGYYTINPFNSSAEMASRLSWKPGGPTSAGPYGVTQASGVTYAGPLGTILPWTASLAAQESGYLTRIYVDVNGNTQPDESAGEPYRMVVTGAQVRPAESMRVETATIDVPRSPERSIPGGFIPFQFYWPKQVQVAGATAGDEDEFLFGQRSFYTPFSIYNVGNVNLWNVRLDKYDPYAGHLYAPDVDPNLFAGASEYSNWPGSGVIKRFNLASTLDALPLPKDATGGPGDFELFTPVRKPRPGSLDDGRGQLIQVKDVFPFPESIGFKERTVQSGLPYLTVAVPPGTPPGRYSTRSGRLVLFEDSGSPYIADRTKSYNGILDFDANGPIESGVSDTTVVSVTVGETRLTDKVSRLAPFIPVADTGVAFAARFNGAPNDMGDLTRIWQTLAQDATPSGYRDPRTGALVTFWSSNRVQVGSTTISPLKVTDDPTNIYRIFASAMLWNDPVNPPINAGADVDEFRKGALADSPWGWTYQGGNVGTYWFPKFGDARWFGQPNVGSWIPTNNVLKQALNGDYDPLEVTFTAPSPITDFQGVDFPGMVFYTGTVGVGSQQRSAIFYAPVKINNDGTVQAASDPQAIGVSSSERVLDPTLPKYQPRPFLITEGGEFLENGLMVNQKLLGLGVVWFGGAPGKWGLYVSTIHADDLNGDGMAKDGTAWKTTQLRVPEGVTSALHPSVYYHQVPFHSGNDNVSRRGVLEMAFSGYSRSGRNPDIYVARFTAMSPGNPSTIGNWAPIGFARRGSAYGGNDRPLEPLQRLAGETRPVYRAMWSSWYGTRNLSPEVFWFRKPVSNENDDYELVATYRPRVNRGLGQSDGYVLEAEGRGPNGNRFSSSDPMSRVTAFFDLAAGTVRFTTSNPVSSPAPLSRAYTRNGRQYQDFIFASMNPNALRVTMNTERSATMPQIWVDESMEVVTQPNRVSEQVKTIDDKNPLAIRRDRMWVMWRETSAAEGAPRASGLFHQTYRLAVDLGAVIPVSADNNTGQLRQPRIVVSRASGGWEPNAYTVDPERGRLYFTMADDGNQVRVSVNGENVGEFGVQWLPEATQGPVRYGYSADYRLPLGIWTQPRSVGTLEQGNDTQPFLFKDPFSYQVPPGLNGTPSDWTRHYYTRGNNNMWLFWASTRPSRSSGIVRSAPSILNTAPVDPYYYSETEVPNGGLLYSGSASDVYCTALSPDF